MPFNVCYVIIFGYAPIVPQALRMVTQPGDFPPSKGYVNVDECPQILSKDMWGLWVDGRDAHRGINAYGEEYHGPVMSALQLAYQMARTHSDEELSYPIFIEMIQPLHPRWRIGQNPNMGQTRRCHNAALPSDVVQKIMSTVDYKWDDRCMKGHYVRFREYKALLIRLFDAYNRQVHGFPGRDAELFYIARLAQNLAFLHPLGDLNGRSRLSLIQYLLRQRHIGCGTMMYNNKKNILFSTALDYAKLLDEGIKIYDEASATNFSTNPWNTTAVQDSHHAQFPTPAYTPELTQCWNHFLNGGNVGTSTERVKH